MERMLTDAEVEFLRDNIDPYRVFLCPIRRVMFIPLPINPPAEEGAEG